MLGHAYVKKEEYKTKKEQKWIEQDTKQLRLTYYNGKYRDKNGQLELGVARYDINKGGEPVEMLEILAWKANVAQPINRQTLRNPLAVAEKTTF